MPHMPPGDPWPSLRELLKVETALRLGQDHKRKLMEPYWEDLARLLDIFALTRQREHLPTNELREVARLKQKMSTNIYRDYIRKRERKLVEQQDNLLAGLGI